MSLKVRKERQVPLEALLEYFEVLLRDPSASCQKIAAAMDISPHTLLAWERTKPELALVRKRAEERGGSTRTFSDYVFKSLSPEAQKVWTEIKLWAEHTDYQRKITVITSGLCKRLRQELFINALVHTNFDMSKACQMTGTPYRTLKLWREKDLEFAQLVDEIQWHKKNFFEKALLDLVEVRHPLATIFVNRTVNADRGYSEKLRVEHSTDSGFRFEDLDLDIETKKKVLEAIRKKQAVVTAPLPRKALPAPSQDDTQDAEVLEEDAA